MATCMECVHYELCRDSGFLIYHSRIKKILTLTENVERQCPFKKFKHKAGYAEVKHGHWIYQHRHRGGFELKEGYDRLGNPHMVTIDNRYETDDPYCSICGKLNDGNSLNYCSNCGAKMDGRSEKQNDM